MKKKILMLYLPLLILLAPVKIFSQAFPSDTLLFDGGINRLIVRSMSYCTVKVLSYSGDAYGTRVVKEVVKICGSMDTSYKLVRGHVRLGDELFVGSGDELFTLEGTLKVQLKNGTILTLNPQTKIEIRDNYCENPGAWIKIINGIFCYDAGNTSNGKQLICHSPNAKMEIVHTLYTVEVTGEADIVRVYDGQVRVSLSNPPEPEKNDTKEIMEQIMEDYKAGKISAEEVGKKINEINEEIRKKASKLRVVTIDAGNKCISEKYSLTVEPIESSDERWWEKIK